MVRLPCVIRARCAASENGGFSSGPMPQDIVVGEDAEKVADFVAKYSGTKR